MGFSEKQMRALTRKVPARAVRSRVRAGRELSYIEGWYVVSQANRIFGFDGWDRETVETKCILLREGRGTATAIYSAKVRITVRTSDLQIIRDGHGTGEAHGDSAAEVHDRALKAAETDATKRALATFGKAFGLELHAGSKSDNVTSESRTKENKCRGLAEDSSLESAPMDVGGGVCRKHQSAYVNAPTSGVSLSSSGLEAREGESEPLSAGSQDVRSTPRPLATANGGRSRGGIDKAVLTFPEPSRIRDKDHLRFVASQPCLLCSAVPSDAHHVRFAQPRAMSRKVGDDFTVPLCRAHHRMLHNSGDESAFWHDIGIDPLEIARDLWEETHPHRR